MKKYSPALFLLFLFSCRNGIQLEETPVSVKKISEIGEMVCAEYYGEVVESLRAIETDEDVLRFKNYYNSIRNDLLREYDNTDKKWKKNKRIRKAVNQYIKNNKAVLKRETTWQLQKICYRYEYYDFLSLEVLENDWGMFYTRYQKRIDKRLTDDLNGSELVYIGRGWVKAGFDFKDYNFDANAVLSGDTLTLKNLNPVILDADINPWFTQDEIKGFEIIKMEKERKIELSQVALVKSRCKYKLRQQAIQRDILNFSIESAEETLEGLFALLKLKDEKTINKVIIEPTEYFFFLNDIVSDGIVDKDESAEIKKRYSQRYLSSLDSIISADDTAKYDEAADQMIEEIHLYTLGNNNSSDWNLLYDSLKSVSLQHD